MPGPAVALQKAVFAALNNDVALKTAFGGVARIHDRVPSKPEFPYITIGRDQIVRGDGACDDEAFDAYVEIHVWSRDTAAVKGKVGAKRLGDLVSDALAALTVDGFVVTENDFDDATYFDDPDGLTAHGVVTHRLLLDAA